MKFQRFLYNVQIGELSVAKYQQDDESVTLVAESGGEAVSGYAQMDFDSQEDYVEWIDEIIGDRDEFNADADIVQDVLTIMKSKASQEVYDARYKEKSTKKLVSFNLEKHSELLLAISKDDMSFSERCKQLLAEYYDIKN